MLPKAQPLIVRIGMYFIDFIMIVVMPILEAIVPLIVLLIAVGPLG